MIVDSIMTNRVVTVDIDDSLRIIKNVFEDQKFHHLLVIENNSLCGIISDRDYFKAVSPFIDSDSETSRDLYTLNRRAHQIMSRKPKCLYLGDSVLKAIALFDAHDISCIPILNPKGTPVGILSWRDILRRLASLANKNTREKS